MDFFVGGLPRGGTTASARLLHNADDTYCYAAETHLIRLFDEFVGLRPARPDKIEYLMDILRAQNQHVLIEMVAFNVARGATREYSVFDEAAISELESHAHDVLASGQFAAEAIVNIMTKVAEILRTKSGKTRIGEKTPQNTISLLHHPQLAAIPSVHIVREPFSSFVSSANRARDQEDKFNSAFSQDFLFNVGLYLEFSDAMTQIRNLKNTYIFRYEDACLDIENYIKNICSSIGLEMDDAGFRRARGLFQSRSQLSQISTFSDVEIAQTLGILRNVLPQFGYDQEFFAANGKQIGVLNIEEEATPTGILPLYGATVTPDGGIMVNQIRAKLAATAAMSTHVLEIDIQPVAGALTVKADEAKYVDVFADDRLIGRYGVSESACKMQIEIPEESWFPLGAAAKQTVVELRPNFIFRPSTDHPISRDRVARALLITGYIFR